MKKLIYLLPLLILTAGCVKTDTREGEPLVPYGTFNGIFKRTYTDPATSAPASVSTTVKVVMTTSGFSVISNDEAIHANSTGEFLGNELIIEFTDTTYPAGGAGTKTFLHGTYSYQYNGSIFKLYKQTTGDVCTYDLEKQQ